MRGTTKYDRCTLNQPLKPWMGGNEPPGMGLRRVSVGKPTVTVTLTSDEVSQLVSLCPTWTIFGSNRIAYPARR